MADVIVYPWHGLPERFIDSGGYYAPQITSAFDSSGPILHNRFGIAERLADNGDGTYSRVVVMDTDLSDKLVHENGLLQRYSEMGDGTYCRVVALTTSGGTDVFVSNAWGLQEKYIDLTDGTYALLVGQTGADYAVYNEYGLPLGLDTSGGFALPIYDGLGPSINDANAAANSIIEGAANDTALPIALEVANPASGVTYSNWQITTQSVPGAFTINPSTGEITVADGSLLDYELATSQTITVAIDTSEVATWETDPITFDTVPVYIVTGSISRSFTITILDVAEATSGGGEDLPILMVLSDHEFTGYLQ